MSNPARAASSRLVAAAQRIREEEHKLKPKLRLMTTREIVEFIHDASLVSALGGNELPSLISAVLGRPWKPSAKGFTGWLDWWSIKIGGQRIASIAAELERRQDILATRIFRRSKTLISKNLWPILAPIVEDHRKLLTRGEILSPIELTLRKIIEIEGSIRTDRLRNQAKMEGRENNNKFHRALSHLENYGLIVGAEDPQPETHMHANIWQTWESRTAKTGPQGITYEKAFVRLLEATVQACVIVREENVQSWYNWNANPIKAKEQLLDNGSIVRVGDYLIRSDVRAI